MQLSRYWRVGVCITLALWHLPKQVHGFSLHHPRQRISHLPIKGVQARVSTFPGAARGRISQHGQTPCHQAVPFSNSLFAADRCQNSKTNIWGGLMRKLCLSLLPLFWSILPQRASAATSALSNLWPKRIPTRRLSIRIALSIFAITFVIRFIRLRQRQALDATSEWSRYANQ